MGVAFVRNRQLAEVRLTEDLRAEIGNKPSSCIAHAFGELLAFQRGKNRSNPF